MNFKFYLIVHFIVVEINAEMASQFTFQAWPDGLVVAYAKDKAAAMALASMFDDGLLNTRLFDSEFGPIIAVALE